MILTKRHGIGRNMENNFMHDHHETTMSNPPESIRVLLSGYGKMGHEVEKMLNQHDNYEILAICQSTVELKEKLHHYQPDLVIDFSTPDAAYPNAKLILEQQVRAVIGTTGFAQDEINELCAVAKKFELGGIIAPNFSIAAVLMMKAAAQMARFLPEVEIIEKHHAAKLDAPSGTAIKTAELIAAQRQAYAESLLTLENTKPGIPSKETIAHVRGGVCHGIHIHSMRLTGCVADQEIIFGSPGETLSLVHRTINREAFMPGVHLACQKVFALQEWVYGLEHVLGM